MKVIIMLTASLAALATTIAMAIEEPDYVVTDVTADYEIRSYAPFIVAETEVPQEARSADSSAFRILAGYIFGDNRAVLSATPPKSGSKAQTNVKMAMTAPVLSTAPAAREADKQVYGFVMPAGYAMETLPVPLDSRVTIREVPARLVAARRYSGRWTRKSFETHLTALQEALDRNGITAVGSPLFARYNAPFTPWFMRRNEVMIELSTDLPQSP